MPTKFEKLKEDLAKRNAERPKSPLEEWVLSFFPVCKIFDYVLEYQVDYYFIDIAWPYLKFGVELDGEEFHKDKIRDEKRDNYLCEQGWEIKRIPSGECWPRKFMGITLLGKHLEDIYFKVNAGAEISYGLAEILGREVGQYNSCAPQLQSDDFCNVCKSFHFVDESCEEARRRRNSENYCD
jgi:hypothetical protein